MSADKKIRNKQEFNKRWLLGAACAGFVLAGLPALSYAQAQMDSLPPILPSGLLISVSLDAPLQNGEAGDVRFMDKAAMQSFYAARKNEPYWLTGWDKTRKAEELVGLIEQSWTHGLNPESYHLKELRTLMENPKGDNADRLELTLTDAAMRYAHDMSGMRINAGDLGLKAKYWRQPLNGPAVAQGFMQARDITAALKAMAPQSELYRKMQAELVNQAREANKTDNLLPLAFGGAYMFKPGQSQKDVAKLRKLLEVDYDPANGPENFYDDDLAAAVMNFQRERNLEPDGIIGPSTISVLNRSHRDAMEQIVANMERLRWLGNDTPSRYIMVNIPSQRLWAIENGRVAEEMDVVVGLPARQTKQFKTEVTGVRFNPTWTVPLNLKMQDFKPKLVRNPDYLTDSGISVIKGVGSEARTLDPHSVDWENISWREMNKMRFVQKPGDHNALGRIRVLMPSEYDIYMHDTNHKEFFERTQRTYSSGCIRLSKPEAVARFILKDNADWSDAKMDALIDAGKMVEVDADKPFPVYIVYQSIWLDDNGGLVFGPDVYKQDKKLIDALARQKGYALPKPEKDDMASLDGAPVTALASAQ
jgi:murein L,D-transpeptidase YcbB/YkuD